MEIKYPEKYWESNLKILEGISGRNDVAEPFTVNGMDWQFIREIEEEKPVCMTNRQLSEWCSKHKGEWMHKPSHSGMVYTQYKYRDKDKNKKVNTADEQQIVVIRPYGTDEWIEPTVDIYERDCKGE